MDCVAFRQREAGIFPPEAHDCCSVGRGLVGVLLLTSGHLRVVNAAADRCDEGAGEGVGHQVVDALDMPDVR